MSIFKRKFAPNKWKKEDGIAPDSLRIRAVGIDGNPVSDASAGDSLTGNFEQGLMVEERTIEDYFKGISVPLPSGKVAILRFISEHPLSKSGTDGTVTIPTAALQGSRGWPVDKPFAIYVINVEKMIGGLVCYRGNDFGKATEVVLKPLCHIHGGISRADEKALPVAKSFVYWGSSRTRLRFAEQGGEECVLDTLVPPGEYMVKSNLMIDDNEGNMRALEDYGMVKISSEQTSLKIDMKLVLSKEIIKALDELPASAAQQKNGASSP